MKELIPSEGVEFLEIVNKERGLLWEKIELIREEFLKTKQAINHHTPEWEQAYPLKHHIEGGLYTREIFMPKNNICISFIHKQDHPSFLLKGEVSVILDNAEIKRLKAPCKIFTKAGTQRMFFIHEDTTWVCVYKTDQENIKDIEKDIYTLNYKELDNKIINNYKQLWQE